MDLFRAIRAYWPAIVAAVFSLLIVGVLSPLRDSELAYGLFKVLRWVPLVGLAFAFGYGGWVTFRFSQADRGVGLLCRCGGPLGAERTGYASRGGAYRPCYACGDNVNHRHYE